LYNISVDFSLYIKFLYPKRWQKVKISLECMMFQYFNKILIKLILFHYKINIISLAFKLFLNVRKEKQEQLNKNSSFLMFFWIKKQSNLKSVTLREKKQESIIYTNNNKKEKYVHNDKQ